MFFVDESESTNPIEDQSTAVIESKYGFHLVQYFHTNFGDYKNHTRYQCDPRRCRAKKLLQNSKNYETADTDVSYEESLEAIFQRNCSLLEKEEESKDKETFLKHYVSHNINLKHLCDFYKANYFGEGELIIQFISE